MSVAELRKRAKRIVDALPNDEVREAASYLDYLSERSGTTLRKRPPIAERLRRSQAEFRAGKGTPVSKLKRKY